MFLIRLFVEKVPPREEKFLRVFKLINFLEEQRTVLLIHFVPFEIFNSDGTRLCIAVPEKYLSVCQKVIGASGKSNVSSKE